MTRVVLCFLLLYIFQKEFSSMEVPFKPKFHTPNDYDYYGNSCSTHLPSYNRSCPIFGIHTTDRSNSDIESICSFYGFSCPETNQHLFVDGSCRQCPEGMKLVEENSDVFCKNPNDPSITAFKNLINPFDCIDNNPLIISRSTKGSYRPCYNVQSKIIAEVKHYSSGYDLSGEITMAACSKNLKEPISPSSFNYKGLKDLPFSVIGSLDDVTYAPEGYLACSTRDPPNKAMTSPIWKSFYSFYAFGFVFIILFAIFKYVKEHSSIDDSKSMRSINSTDLSEASSDMLDPSNFLHQSHIVQKGYIKTTFGKLAFFLLTLMSIGLAVLILMIILDIYGLHYKTFCKNDTEVQEACKISIEQGNDPSWRLGYSCAAGCAFSYSKTKGAEPDWPFYDIPGGEAKITISFFAVWHITLVWWLLLKLYSNNVVSFFYIRCDLSTASYVLISKPIEDEIVLQSEASSLIRRLTNYSKKFIIKIRGKPSHHKFCKITTNNYIKSFDFQCLRYCWNEASQLFQVSQFAIDGTQEEISSLYLQGLSEEVSTHRHLVLGSNSLDIDIPSLFMAIFSEFFDYLYLYQFFTLLAWLYTNYWTVSLVTLSIIAISATVKIITRRKSQWKVKRMAHRNLDVWVFRDQEWKKISSSLLVPGDLIKFTSSCSIPCDSILLDGRCVLDESTLTGEPTPVPKISLSPNSSQKYDSSQANMKYTLFAGSYLQSFSPGRYGSTLAVVTATGASTNKGKLMKDLLFPPPFSFTFEQHLNAVYIVLLLWSLCVMGLVLFFMGPVLDSWVLSIFIIAHIFTPLIPAVYVAALSQGAIHLSKKNVFCINFHRMSVAGKIKVFCFDKTGTLTKPGLEFRGLQYCSDTSTSFKYYSPKDSYPYFVKLLCGSCHELDFLQSEDSEITSVGNEVDVALYTSSGFNIESLGSTPVMKLGSTELRILRRFEFDRATMSMSVIVQDQDNNKFVFTKGSYEVISRMVVPNSLPSNYFDKADSLAKEGIYLLGMAYKPYLGPSNVFEALRDSVESDLTCLGLIMFENPLKENTPSVIEELKKGKIKPRILTGDNSLTASYIARTSKISTSNRIILGDVKAGALETVIWTDFDSNATIDNPLSLLNLMECGEVDVAITGRAYLSLIASEKKELGNENSTVNKKLAPNSFFKQILPYIRIFSRLTPDQKVIVIAEQMKMALTGMCGDGANDLGALRLAHCGVAISSGSSEAGLVSHFSSPNESLESVLHVLKEGRSTLAKALSSFKALIVFGQTKALLGLLQYYFAVVAPELYWITWDAILYLGMSWCLLQSHAAKSLHHTRPTAKMFGFETLFSVCSIVFINWAFMIGTVLFLFSRKWFLCNEFDANNINRLKWWLKGDNFESSVISILTTFQLMSAGPAFNFGFKYRGYWWKNHWMTIFCILSVAFYSYMFLSGPSFVSCMFRTNCGDKSLISDWINNNLISSRTIPDNAPEGCACDQQIPCQQQIEADYCFCEEEYINCDNDVFNSSFHHNIIPKMDLINFYIIGVINFLFVIFWEYFIVLGPGRKFVKKFFKKNPRVSN